MKTAGIRDVASLAGVSMGTVSNVINRPEKVRPEVIARVKAAIDELGYVGNDSAPQLRFGSSSSVGLIIPDGRNPFFADIARGAESAAVEHGLSVFLGNSDNYPEREITYLKLFERQRVRGALIYPMDEEAEHLHSLQRRGTPIVLIDRTSPNFDSIAVDDVIGGRLAAEHLLERGRRRIAFVGGPSQVHQIADRLLGASTAIAESAAELEVLTTPNLSVEDGWRVGSLLANRPADERPDGIFAANDLIAIGLLRALVVDRGIRVPQEIAVVGYDDIDFAQAAIVPLSSVRQPSEQIGRTAIETLIDRAANGGEPRTIQFRPTLVPRTSTLPGP